MDGICFYLPLILIMRSGDVETNPGPRPKPKNLLSTVGELELRRLTDQIPARKYLELGIHLGVPYRELCTIRESSNSHSDTFMGMFSKWRDSQPPNTDFRQVLVWKLNETRLYDLAEEVLKGNLIYNSKGDPLGPFRPYIPLLSPELVAKCKSDLKFRYRSSVCKIRADPLNPDSILQFEDMFIHLDLEEEIGDSRRPLDYKDLFDVKVNGEFPRRIFLQGEAGVGKTTLCAKIAWDWVNERYGLGQYELAFIIKLRDRKQYTIGEIAKYFMIGNNPTTVCQLTQYIRTNPDKVLIVFDAFDEYHRRLTSEDDSQLESSGQGQSMEIIDASSQTQEDANTVYGCACHEINILEIIRSNQLEKCPVLVTCRPWRAREIRSDDRLKELYTIMHVKGFSEDNLLAYFRKYFPNDEATFVQIRALMRENEVISEHLVQYPIHVSALCLMWRELCDEDMKDINCLQTKSQIVREMLCFLQEQYAQKKVRDIGSPRLNDCLHETIRLLKPVSQIALFGLLENKLVFSQDDFKKCPESLEIACRSGVLSQEDRLIIDREDESRSHLQTTIFFPHDLFQEYMAGKHLALMYDSDRLEFNKLMEEVVLPQKDEYLYLLYFTILQSKNVAIYVIKSLMKGDACRGKKRDLIVNFLVESQHAEAAAFMREMLSSSKIELKVEADMTPHTLAGYSYTLLDLMKLSVERDCGPAMTCDVAEIMCATPTLKEVYLGPGCTFFQDWLFKKLAKNGKNSKVQMLCLEGVQLPSPSSSKDLGVALCSMPNLADLTLGQMNLHDDFYSSLKELASNMQVRSLCLRSVSCSTPSSSHDFAVALCSMPNLTDLTLIGVELGDEFFSTLRAIAIYLMGFPQFSSGEFSFNGLTWRTLDAFLQSLAQYRRAHSRKRTSMLTALHQRQLRGHLRSPYQLPVITWNRTEDGYRGNTHGSRSASSSSSGHRPRTMHQAAFLSSRRLRRAYPDMDFYPDFQPLVSGGSSSRADRIHAAMMAGRHPRHRRMSHSWYEAFLASQEDRIARRRMGRHLADFGAHSSLPWDPGFMYPSMTDFSSHPWSFDFDHRSHSSRHYMPHYRYPFFDDGSDSD